MKDDIVEIGLLRPPPHDAQDRGPVCSLIEATKHEWLQLIKPLPKQPGWNSKVLHVEAGFVDEPLLDTLLDRRQTPTTALKLQTMARVITVLDD